MPATVVAPASPSGDTTIPSAPGTASLPVAAPQLISPPDLTPALAAASMGMTITNDGWSHLLSLLIARSQTYGLPQASPAAQADEDQATILPGSSASPASATAYNARSGPCLDTAGRPFLDFAPSFVDHNTGRPFVSEFAEQLDLLPPLPNSRSQSPLPEGNSDQEDDDIGADITHIRRLPQRGVTWIQVWRHMAHGIDTSNIR